MLIYKILTEKEKQEWEPALIQLALDSYGTHANNIGSEAAATMLQGIARTEMWEELFHRAIAFVCFEEAQPVGAAYFIPGGNPWKFFQADWAYIRMVGVLPGKEGMGIGRKLMSFCVAEAQRRGEKILALHTSEFMDAARHLYESMGFVQHSELEPFFGRQYWIYHLELKEKGQ